MTTNSDLLNLVHTYFNNSISVIEQSAVKPEVKRLLAKLVTETSDFMSAYSDAISK